jgi:hypothetical protein
MGCPKCVTIERVNCIEENRDWFFWLVQGSRFSTILIGISREDNQKHWKGSHKQKWKEGVKWEGEYYVGIEEF